MIGILFTAVIPMFLMMNQADVLLEQKKLTIKRVDDEKSNEQAEVWVYPTDVDSPESVTVLVKNTCGMPIHLIRAWFNETIFPLDTMVQPMSNVILPPFTVKAHVGNYYDICVSTERGNIYESKTGPLYYNIDGWVIESFGITVIIPFREDWMVNKHWSSNFEVTIWKVEGTDQVLVYPPTEIIRAISASERFLPLREAGQYRILVQVWVNQYTGHPAHWHTIWDKTDETSLISWPDGSSLITVPIVTPLSEHNHSC